MTDLVIRVRADGTAEVARGMRNVDQAVGQMGGKAGAASAQMGKLGATAGVARNSLGQFQSTTGTASQGLLAMTMRTTGLVAGLAGVGLGVKSAVSAFVDYDSTMRRVGAIMGATEGQMVSMRDMAQELGATTKFSTGEAAQGFQFLGMAGLDAEQALAALPGVLNLAAAGALSLGEAADISTNILGAYGKTAEDLTEVNDIMSRTFLRSNTDLRELGQAAIYSAGTAKAANQDFLTFNITLGLLADVGVKGSQAGTALGMAMTRLLDPTGAATKALEGAGIAVRDADGNVRQFDAILADLSDTSGAAALLIEAFGQEAGAKLVNVLGLGREAIERKREVISDYEGAARSAAEALKGSLGGALTQLSSAAEGAGIALVGVVEPALIVFFDTTASVVGVAAAALREFDDEARIVATALGTLLVARTLGPILTALGSAALAAATGMTTAATAAGVLRGALALLGGPAGLVITLGIGLVALAAASDDDADAADLAADSNRELAKILAQQAPITDNASASIIANARANLEGARAALAAAEAHEANLRTLDEANGVFGRHEDAQNRAGAAIERLRGNVERLEGNLNRATGRLEEQRGALRNGSQLMELLGETTRETAERTRAGTDAVNEAIEAAKNMRGATVKATEALESAGEQFVANDAHVQAYRESLEATGPAAQAAADAQRTAAEESERAWKALGDSIQTNLSSAFEKLLKGTGDIFQTIKDWFIKLLADLAAAALARPIMIAIGMSGAGTALAAGNAAASGGGFFGGGAGVAGTLYSSALLGLGGGLAGIAPTFASGLLATGGMIGQSGLIGGSLAALGNAGALAATGNLLAAAGAALPILLPIAGAVLAFGGLLKSTPPRAFALADASTGDLLQVVEKKGGEAEGLIQLLGDVVDTTRQTLENIGGQLGEGAGTFDFHINPDRLRFTFRLPDGAQIETDVDPEDAAAVADAIARTVFAAMTAADFSEAAEPVGAFFDAITLEMIEALPQGAAQEILQAFANIGDAAERAADKLPFLGEAIRELAAQGETGAQDLARFTVAAIAVGDALSTDPFTAYEQAIEDAGDSAYTSARKQGDALRDLIRDYDGSVGATERLAQGVIDYKTAAVQAAAEIAAAQQQIANSVKSSTERILIDTLTAEQRQEYYLTQASNALDALSQATDPQQVAQLFAEFERYTLAAWDTLSEEQKQLLRDNYIRSLEEGAAVANRQLEAAAQTLADEFEQISNAVTLGMLRAFEAAGLVVEGSAAAFEAHINSAAYQFQKMIEQSGAVFRDAAGWVANRIANASSNTGEKPALEGETVQGDGFQGTPRGFATGGMHAGGWRIVGEQGPELEFTGPSRIFSNGGSVNMIEQAFRGALRGLQGDIQMLRAETNGLRQQFADYGRRRVETEQERAARERRLYDRARLR